ncbi:MAG: extracellular solute-binding protein [Acholeplasmataceae bacterium]|nr:extracellular solute-binding protein [Acholeplasmataceae bacterium]
MKAHLTKVKSAFSSLGPKRITIILLVAILLVFVLASFFRQGTINTHLQVESLSSDYSNVESESVFDIPYYSSVKAAYERDNLALSTTDLVISTDDMTGTTIGVDDPRYGDAVTAYLNDNQSLSGEVMILESDKTISFVQPHDFEGLYRIAIDYFETENNINDTQIALTINGESPFYESQTLVLPSSWSFVSETFKLDRYENEIQPTSEKNKAWRTHQISDYRGLHPGLFEFHLEKDDVITLASVNGGLLIGNITFVTEDPLISYEDYLSLHGDHDVVDSMIMTSARLMSSRTDPSIRLRAEQDPSNLFYDTQSLRLNVIHGESWQNAGQAITYVIDAPASGYYHLSFKYRQYMIKDMAVFRKITVNGDIPFKDFEHVAFPYTTTFVNRTLTTEDGTPLKIWLEAGANEVSFEAVNYPYRTTIETIRQTMKNIQDLALDIKRYTSGGTDRYRDWDIEAYFPDAAGEINQWATILRDAHQALAPASINDNPSEIGSLLVAADRLEDIALDINKLPSRMVQFSDGDSSVNQILGLLMQNLMRSNLEMERFVFHGDNDLTKPFANIFVRVFEGAKRLILSFINNPYSASTKDDGALQVWVNHPRQYIEIMQTLIDQNYDGDMKVTLSQMPDQNKLILANTSGEAPDVAIGVNHWIPYEFAIREASLDLRQFSGYADLVTNFTKGAMIPYVFEEGVYGLPGTQNFWVTYYRKDILESIGISDVPQTWDEIIEILPLLQSYGMNYFVPLAMFSGLKPFVATLPFIYQFGGDLYTADGMQTAINSEETLEGIKLMSELFTHYNVPKYVGNFFNHFRYGMLPIGISDLSTYLMLETAAAELDGLWAMDLHPGVYDPQSDEIIRYAAVGGQSNMILSSTEHKDDAWDFLSWWMSEDIQTEFAFTLQSTYGKAYFWNTANINAFANIPMPSAYKDIILEQWTHGIEASRIPGNYMVERELSNAWTKIVFEGTNPRQALDEAVRISNREILYKMAEFGYTANGVIIKEYVVPSIYNIDRWLTEVDHD